jgi:hypothetical protein
LSLSGIRENALASIAARAIRIAASAAVASMQVMNLSIALRLRVLALNSAFPFAPLAARWAFTIVLSIRYKLSRDFDASVSKTRF